MFYTVTAFVLEQYRRTTLEELADWIPRYVSTLSSRLMQVMLFVLSLPH